MSRIPKTSGIPSRLVSASATFTKNQPGENVTHTTQRTRVAQVQSCCGSGTGEAQAPSTNLPQPRTSQLPQSRLPPPCCSTQKARQPCAPKGNQTGIPPPRSIAQPGFSRPPAQTGISKLRPPQPGFSGPPVQTGISKLRPPQPSATAQSRSLSAPSSSRQTNLPTMQKSVQESSRQTVGAQEGSKNLTCRKETMLPKSALKPPEKIESKIKSSLLNKSLAKPRVKVTAKAKQITQAPAESMETPKGIEPVLQKAVFEKRIERDERGESLIKNLKLSKLNDQNEMDQVEMGIQQLDPNFPSMKSREIVGVTSTISVTPSYATVSRDYVRALTEEKEDIGMSPEEVAKLVEEEKEDVDNTLKMIPPDLMLSPGKYEMKQRLQQLRLNSESVALLEQSIIQPEITADEAQSEPSPEAVATVMHTVETGITPDATPDQVFNSLFREPPNEHFINLSSVTPGPLQDVVVPTDIPKEIHKEAVTNEMSKLTEKLNNIQPGDIPYVDIFTKVMSYEQKSPVKGKNLPRTFQKISDEKSLWVNADLEHLVNVVGAEPADILDPFNLDELEKSENLEAEMANGLEYFLEANPIQYMNRVQLRGTQMPTYFPGYMVAVPDFPDLMKIVKTPDEVFAIAWKSVQPKYFDEESMVSFM
ncbi:uncharacterized protein LOC130903561 [Diorhabda carinulata]|uniref:uncharacterized protein LOC130903561 n=1 Tax=Diorhabda carinulata TaxID=1163345 RepID=UPI0025A1C8D4|nr:uncharacterized protein LOC130903561 [Diorhabda carinulata]